MSVHRETSRHGKVFYRVKWRDDHGSQHSRSFASHQDARDFDVEVKSVKSKGEPSPTSNRRAMTLDQLASIWFDTHVLADLAPGTQVLYADIYDRYISRLGHRRVHDFSREPMILIQWRADLVKGSRAQRPIGAETFIKCKTILSGIFEVGKVMKAISTNPAKLLELVKANDDEHVRALDPEVVEQIRMNLTTREHRALLSLMGWVGLRPAEAQRLEWRHVKDGWLHIEKTKTRKKREAPLPELVAQELDALPRENEFVLGKEWTGNAWKNWQQRPFVRACEAAGEQLDIELTKTVPYDMRHSSISARLRSVPTGRFSSNQFIVARHHGNSTRSMEGYSWIVEAAADKVGVPLEEQLQTARAAAIKRGPKAPHKNASKRHLALS